MVLCYYILYYIYQDLLRHVPENYNALLQLGKINLIPEFLSNALDDEFNLEELKNFRKINSQCTGHPEYNLNNRIEVTTGPLGEGFATSVGLAIGEKYLESTFNKKKNIVFDYRYIP